MSSSLLHSCCGYGIVLYNILFDKNRLSAVRDGAQSSRQQAVTDSDKSMTNANVFRNSQTCTESYYCMNRDAA